MPENIFCLSIFANDDRVSRAARSTAAIGAATLLAGHGSFLSVQQKDQFLVLCLALRCFYTLLFSGRSPRSGLPARRGAVIDVR
jgi:hypothetical protein